MLEMLDNERMPLIPQQLISFTAEMFPFHMVLNFLSNITTIDLTHYNGNLVSL